MSRRKKKKVVTKESKFISFEKFLKYKNAIIAIVGVIAALYPIIDVISNSIYRKKCEKFYKLPGKYFHININDGLLYLASLLIFLALCFVPTLITKYKDRIGFSSKLFLLYAIPFSIVTGLVIGYVNVLNLIEIMKQTYKVKGFFIHINDFLNEHAYLIIGTITLMGVLASITMTLLDKIVKIKQKAIERGLEIIFFVTFIISGAIMVSGTLYKLDIHIEDKTKYEMVTVENKEYFVITDTNGKQLIVKYTVDEEETYYFKTDSYMFIDEYSGDAYNYIQLSNSPIILENESE